MDLTLLGMSCIVLAWMVQFEAMWHQEETRLKVGFVGLYVLGVALLVADGLAGGAYAIAFLNLFVLVLSSLVLIRLNYGIKAPKGKLTRGRIQAGVVVVLVALVLLFFPLIVGM